MCVVSMISDHYSDKWQRQLADYQRDAMQKPPLTNPHAFPFGGGQQERLYPPLYKNPEPPTIPQADLDEFYKLLERAREYDKRNNEPECELEEKKKALLEVARKFGVEIEFK